MRVPREVLGRENRRLDRGGDPTLRRAYATLRAEWRKKAGRTR